MYTIFDYIDYYKGQKLDEVKWNMMDNLICSLIAYCPIKETINKTTLRSLYESVKNLKKDKGNLGTVAVKVIEIISLIYNSPRYKNIKIDNFVKVKNNNIQFGALTLRLDGLTIVSFKGTDRSLIGWLENFRLAYEYPTETQKIALDYLNNNITLLDKNVYVLGHSKGGNLAMYAAMNTRMTIFRRIKNIINFDGPGFRNKEYLSPKYALLKTKLINVIPSNSLVGVLMHNDDYLVVKSKDLGYTAHYPYTWNIFGEYFINDKLSSMSKEIHRKSTVELDKLDPKMLKETTETLFMTIGKEYQNNFKMGFSDMERIYRNINNIDPQVKEYIDTIFTSLIKPSFIGSESAKND